MERRAASPRQLKYPLGLCFDGEGNLFVSDGALTEASFLFTLKFDDAGNWKIVKTHQMSKKELEEEQ